MNTTFRLTDGAIRAALTPATDVHVPAGLADEIRVAVEASPQRGARARWWPSSRRTALVLQLAVVALLLLALIAALALIGSRPPKIVVPPLVSTYHGGPERNGVMPGPGPAGDPILDWEVPIKGSMGAWSPTVVGGVVYLADGNGYVWAFDEKTHAQRWSQPLGAPINSGLTVDAGLVLVGADDGNEYALDAATGAILWHYPTDGAIHTASIALNGVVYFGSTGGSLYAVDEHAGSLHWPAAGVTPGPISRSIAESNGTIYAGSGGASPSAAGSLGAYDVATGRQLWLQPVDPGNTSTPTAAGGRVFVTSGLDATATGQHQLWAFDAKTGMPVWAQPFRVPGGQIVLIGAATADVVYAESDDGNLYAIDATSGTLRWQLLIHSTQSPSAGLVGGILYVTSDDRNVYAIDTATHKIVWKYLVTGVPGSPVVIDGRIIFGTSLGKVYSLKGSIAAPSP